MRIEDAIADLELGIKIAEDIHSTNVCIDIDSALIAIRELKKNRN